MSVEILRFTHMYVITSMFNEIWFYRTKSRRKIKLPRLDKHEKEGDDKYTRRKMLSRRLPVESMIIGVVDCPLPHCNFDGNIFLERVSKKQKLIHAHLIKTSLMMHWLIQK